MVFSSIPAYLDPANWQQQPNNQIGGSGGTSAQLLRPPPPPPPPPPPSQPHVGSIRPGSMADRARMANIPLPEAALKCPRCESTNTKFCYFNNYSLSQPRHFCKTCRRYWTRGGALRSVPVGGGCRRKKRSNKAGSSSKSPVSSDRGQTISSGSTSMIPSNSDGITGDIMGGGGGPHIPPLRFMQAPNLLHHFTDHYGGAGEIGLNFSGISPPLTATGDINFLLGNSSGSGGGSSGGVDGGSFLSGGGIDHQQWRLPPQTHQFPFFAAAGFDQSPTGLFPVDQGQSGVNHEPSISYVGGGAGPVRPKTSASGIISQMASVKMEDNNNQEMNLSRQFLGIQGNDHQYWASTGTTAWTDLSGFSSSSTSQPL